jgi:hypothetical protein
VEEIEIEIVEPKVAHAGVERPQRLIVPIVGHPQLAGDEQLGSRNPATSDTLADLLLVLVVGRVSTRR